MIAWNDTTPGWRNVSADRPCPVCRKPDQCSVSDDGDWCVCYRRDCADAGVAGWSRHTYGLPNNAAGGDARRRMEEVVWCNWEGGAQ